MDIPRLTREALKDLVRDYIGGRVLFSSQVPEQHVHLVFMPIALGGLDYGEAKPELPEEPVKPVRGFVRPVRPVPDAGEARGDLEAAVTGAREALVKAEFRARWGDGAEGEVQAAREALDRAEGAVRGADALAEAAADAAHAKNMEGYREELARHRARMAQWRGEMRAWREACARPEVAAWEERRSAHFDKLKADLGVIYGYRKDAVGRVINGFPMLMSCGLLHRDDWALVRAAIDRELTREIEL